MGRCPGYHNQMINRLKPLAWSIGYDAETYAWKGKHRDVCPSMRTRVMFNAVLARPVRLPLGPAYAGLGRSGVA